MVLLAMNNSANDLMENQAQGQVRLGMFQGACRPSFLHLVSAQELQDLKTALCRGQMPPDFEAKLCTLAGGSLIHRYIAQNCRLFIALLLATREGLFRHPTEADCDRLLRVLAYVRRDDDAIPDYKSNGFMDDQQEVRAAMTGLVHLLHSFKAWRLRHQVPEMWSVRRNARQL